MRILLPLLIFAFLRAALFAQDLRVLWGESGIRLGEQLCFTLISKELVSAAAAAADSISIELSQTNEDWEYIRSEVFEDRVLVWVQCFALDASLFPGLSIRYQNGVSLSTGPQYFYITSPEIDPDADPPIRGIRSLADEDAAVWLLILIVLLLGFALGFWLRRRKKKGYSLPGTHEITDPWRLARERIDMLRQHIPRDEAGIKEHVFLLHETVKQYLGGRVGYSFLEMTSAEVADAYSRFVWTSAERAQSLRVWLQRGDMAKFARELPDTKELARYIDSCESWLAGVESDWQSYQKNLESLAEADKSIGGDE